MATIREQVLAALQARLETLIPGLPDLTVYRNRRTAIPAPGLNLRDGPQQTDSGNTEMKRHRLTALIAGYLEAANDEALGPAINDLYGRVIDAIESDTTLSTGAPGAGPAFDAREIGLDIDVETDADGVPLKSAAGWFYLSIELEFTTRQGDSDQLAP